MLTVFAKRRIPVAHATVALLCLCIFLLLILGGAFTYAASTYALRQTWALYASTTQSGPYHLFIEPFPDAASCRIELNIITSAGGFAQCRSSYQVLPIATADQLGYEFLSPVAPGIRLCRPRPIRITHQRPKTRLHDRRLKL